MQKQKSGNGEPGENSPGWLFLPACSQDLNPGAVAQLPLRYHNLGEDFIPSTTLSHLFSVSFDTPHLLQHANSRRWRTAPSRMTIFTSVSYTMTMLWNDDCVLFSFYFFFLTPFLVYSRHSVFNSKQFFDPVAIDLTLNATMKENFIMFQIHYRNFWSPLFFFLWYDCIQVSRNTFFRLSVYNALWGVSRAIGKGRWKKWKKITCNKKSFTISL